MNYVGFVVTIALLIAGILFNRQDFKELRKELIDLHKEICRPPNCGCSKENE